MFLCDDNEQTSDEGGQRARKRGFASDTKIKKIIIKGVEKGR